MTHDPNSDDHLIVGPARGSDDRPARHAHGDGHEDQAASPEQPYSSTTYSDPTAYGDSQPYSATPTYATPHDGESYPQPPAQAEQWQYPEPPVYGEPQDAAGYRAYVAEVQLVERRTYGPPPAQHVTDVEQTVRRADLPDVPLAAPVAAQPPFVPATPPTPAQASAQPPAYAAPPEPQYVPPQAPPPRPEDLLVPTTSDVATAPASWGWRGKLHRGSGGLIKLRAAPAEVEARQAIVRIQRSFSRPMTVVVVQPKGGAGKTPTTICLASAFGAHRGGYVVGWDDNETRGTLAVRVRNPDDQQATVWDLLSDLENFERQDARVGDLSFYVRAQPDAHFDALVSDDNPANMAQIGDDEFQRLHQVLQRFYRMIVVDTGNNVRSPNWQSAVNTADLVVVVSTYQRDVGFSASWVLDHLAQTGREELARNAVTVLTAADPTVDKQVREELTSHFARRTRAVIEIPYDPELAHGGPIGWTRLAPATRTAWVQAGATVVDALAEQDQRVLAARRS